MPGAAHGRDQAVAERGHGVRGGGVRAGAALAVLRWGLAQVREKGFLGAWDLRLEAGRKKMPRARRNHSHESASWRTGVDSLHHPALVLNAVGLRDGNGCEEEGDVHGG